MIDDLSAGMTPSPEIHYGMPAGSTIPTNPRAEVQDCVTLHPKRASIKEESMYSMNFLGLIQTKLKNHIRKTWVSLK